MIQIVVIILIILLFLLIIHLFLRCLNTNNIVVDEINNNYEELL